MRKQRWSEESEEAHINLTPLLDVLFVLLVTYILIAPIVFVQKVDLAEGTLKEEGGKKQATIELVLSSGQECILEGKTISLEGLEKKLQELHRLFPEKTLMVAIDQKTYFGNYQKVKNSAERAGFEGMDLLLKPQNG